MMFVGRDTKERRYIAMTDLEQSNNFSAQKLLGHEIYVRKRRAVNDRP